MEASAGTILLFTLLVSAHVKYSHKPLAWTCLPPICEHTLQSALELTRALVEKSQDAVPETLLGMLDYVLALVLGSDDASALQSGADCIAAYLHSAPAVVVTRVAADGSAVSDNILQAVSRLLDASVGDVAALYSGKLVTTMFTSVGDALGDDVWRGVLDACAKRLAIARMPSLVQRLVLVFAMLVVSDEHRIVDFLAAVEVSSADGAPANALTVLMTKWLEHGEEFEGSFDRMISHVALSRMLANDRVRVTLGDLAVAGDEVATRDSGGIASRTRLRTKGKIPRRQIVPWSVKLCTLLVRATTAESDDDDDFTDEDDDDEDDEDGYPGGGAGAGGAFAPADDYREFLLSDMAGADRNPFGDHDDDSSGDESRSVAEGDVYIRDAKAHPLYGTDVSATVRDLFAAMAADDSGGGGAVLAECEAALPDHEKGALAGLLGRGE